MTAATPQQLATVTTLIAAKSSQTMIEAAALAQVICRYLLPDDAVVVTRDTQVEMLSIAKTLKKIIDCWQACEDPGTQALFHQMIADYVHPERNA